jgi:sortase (surface protein transpeptidase)
MPAMRRLRSLALRLRGFAARPAVRRGAASLLSLVPALIAGAGVFLVVAGLFNYVTPVAAGPNAETTPPGASDQLPSFSFEPLITPSPGASPTASNSAATRVVVPALDIDLPVVASTPNEEFPLCNVAEYFVDENAKPLLAYPGANAATYLYAHARVGMFLPLLDESKRNNGARMIGDLVEVYTADNRNHVYEITEVIRRVPVSWDALERPMSATTDQLWLQTSEGYKESSTKLQVVAMPVGVLPASYRDAHPSAKGHRC